MSHSVWIAGFPGEVGGADTELDHLIDLFRLHELEVHLVPLSRRRPGESALKGVEARGCRVHVYEPWIFAGKTVLSFCNGEFLKQLPLIARRGRPRRVIWANCMTRPFPAELAAHKQGIIDDFAFVSDYQRRCLLPELERIRPVRGFQYRPFLNLERIDWCYQPWDGTYRMGRISRDDAAKFAPDTWRIFDRVLLPAGVKKLVYILGYGPNAAAKVGRVPVGLAWVGWYPGQVTASHFYRSIDTMVHKTGGSRESCCRVLLEAYAHGVVPVVENDYAFPELVVHGETGFLAASSAEMSYYASFLAMEPAVHRRMAENGREHLAQLVSPQACWPAWSEVLTRDAPHDLGVGAPETAVAKESPPRRSAP